MKMTSSYLTIPKLQIRFLLIKAVAEAYYKNTVFSVISMEIVSQAKNEISFSVCVSKGGVVQEPIVSQLAILEFVHATVLDLPERRC